MIRIFGQNKYKRACSVVDVRNSIKTWNFLEISSCLNLMLIEHFIRSLYFFYWYVLPLSIFSVLIDKLLQKHVNLIYCICTWAHKNVKQGTPKINQLKSLQYTQDKKKTHTQSLCNFVVCTQSGSTCTFNEVININNIKIHWWRTHKKYLLNNHFTRHIIDNIYKFIRNARHIQDHIINNERSLKKIVTQLPI